jgi:thiosulfate/3-mercaptopyruvate sulfurtransferase
MLRRPHALSLSASVLALCLAGAAAAAPEGWGPLLEPAALAGILEAHPEVRVVHVSGDFAAGHIPGAVSAPYAEWRGPPQNPGALRTPEEFGALVRRLGIEADTPVAVVHSGANVTDMGTAARVYWTLRALGVEDLALLNGGFRAWAEAGLPVSTRPVEVAPSGFVPRWDDTLRITTAEVEALIEEGGARLIDARPAGFFQGRVWSIARPGTLPGAGHLSHERWFEGTRMVGAEEAAAIAAESGPELPITVSFCNTGHWAAINWFALSELAGVENTRLYAESMAEWTAAGRPLDNAPHRVAMYWTMTESWIRGMF